MSDAARIQAIDALLPQTQCGKCGHPACLPYAEGIARGEAINKCPPGGQATIAALARLLERPPLPLDAADGPTPAQVAFIREAECIGCTKCIQACPVDAIVGAARLMHTVLRDECTGCDLCVAPCPVDCIDLLPLAAPAAEAQRARAGHFRQRYRQRQARLRRDEAQRQAERARRSPAGNPLAAAPAPAAQPLDAALARVRARQAAGDGERAKRLRIEAAMARVALEKARKQLERHGGDTLAAQVQALQQAADAAQAALDAALAAPAAPDTPAVASQGDALKQARIAAAMGRAQFLKAQKRFGATPDAQQQAQLDTLREDAERADAALRQLQPDTPPAAGSEALKQAKVAYVTRRAALREAEQRGEDGTALRQALADAEQALHAAEAACGRPPPALQRIDKRPVDAEQRALKTELAYARAELQVQTRREPPDPVALERARQRLVRAESRLNDHRAD
ncbi:RnfABCDGE type electron transport complex subunit B [Pseudomonas mangiferae]|uniref:RnfABCDGE type electron transport complex subunit B n=1 Tax=Pseudomonas mangiferae TaxID=2593654 RepID=A0A553GW42_9PSED|nr:RnfABCDGE type electron transport complex subunit B [Pseudomonas mangiferae]